MKIIRKYRKYDRRVVYMKKVETKELLKEILDNSTDDWTKLCQSCSTLIKNAQMTNEEIDGIVERVKTENG